MMTQHDFVTLRLMIPFPVYVFYLYLRIITINHQNPFVKSSISLPNVSVLKTGIFRLAGSVLLTWKHMTTSCLLFVMFARGEHQLSVPEAASTSS